MSGQLEVEKLTALGKEMGLAGKDLLEFVREEREHLKKQRDIERAGRAEEREAQQKERDSERIHEIAMQEKRIQFEQEKTRLEQESLKVKLQMKVEEAKVKAVTEDKAMAMEEELLAKQIKLEEKREKIAELNAHAGANAGANANASQTKFGKVPKLPSFDENKDNVDAYLLRFERYAEQQCWPRDQWAVYLSALLSGKGLEVYYALSNEQASDYDNLKRCILNRYELNEEGFRKKFKYSKPETGESGPQYATRIQNYFQRWVDLATKKTDKAGLVELLICDQFIHSVPKDVAVFIRERKPKTLKAMTELADQYIEAHCGWFHTGGNKGKGTSNSNNNSNKGAETDSQKSESSSKKGQENSRSSGKFKGVCFICNRSGHHARDCRNRSKLNALMTTTDGKHKLQGLLDTVESGDSGKTGATGGSSGNQCGDKAACMMVYTDQPGVIPNKRVYKLECGHELSVITAACPHKSRSSEMVVVNGFVGNQKTTALRDSGCDGVVIKESLVKPEEKTDKYVTCVLLDGTVRRFQTARVQINTPFFVGEVVAKVCPTPVYDLILGQMSGMRDVNDPNHDWIDSPRPTMTECSQRVKNETETSNVTSTISPKEVCVGTVQIRSQAKARSKPFKPLIVPPIDGEVFEVVAVAVIQDDVDMNPEMNENNSEELLYIPSLASKEPAKDVNISLDLEDGQTTEIRRILGNFRDVLTDVPGKTNLVEHKIELTDDVPIRCKPYSIPHAVRGEVRKG